MSNQHARTWEWAFSLNKQTNMATGIVNTQINKKRSIRSFAPSKEMKDRISDKEWFGKGHSFATFSDQITRHYDIATAERSATSLEALFAAAFVLGKVVTTQADSVGNPLEFTHTITFQDLATNKEVLYTSFIEKMGAEYQNKLSGGWVSQFKLTGDRKDHVKLSYQGGARLQVTNAVTMPAITTASFYKTLFGTVTLGPAGAPVDISNQVFGWEFTANQNPQLSYLMGNTAGTESLLSEVLIGNQEAELNLDLKINTTFRDYFLNQTNLELHINAKSPDVITTNVHSMSIIVPHFVVTDEAFSEEGQMVNWKMNVNNDSVLKGAASEYIQIVFVSNIPATELLVIA
jgi:hypothetical protein